MGRNLLFFVLAITLLACEKGDNGLELQLNMKSCVLSNENSYVKVNVNRGEGFMTVTSSDSGIAEIRYEGDNKDVFYIIGHGEGNATVTVYVSNYGGAENTKTIAVNVREPIYYENYSVGDDVYVRKGESRMFKLPFAFNKNYSVVADNSSIFDSEGVASLSASAEMNNKCQVAAKACGSTLFHICKGKVKLYSVRVYVVDEYNLYIPSSEKFTFKLPFTYGINGITIWRGSGRYTARVVDETIARVQSIDLLEDWTNQMNNSAAVRVIPLKTGTTKLIVTDTVTGQTSDVDIVVN